MSITTRQMMWRNQQLCISFDDSGAVDGETCGIVARNWPHLLAKLPLEEE